MREYPLSPVHLCTSIHCHGTHPMVLVMYIDQCRLYILATMFSLCLQFGEAAGPVAELTRLRNAYALCMMHDERPPFEKSPFMSILVNSISRTICFITQRAQFSPSPAHEFKSSYWPTPTTYSSHNPLRLPYTNTPTATTPRKHRFG